MAALTVTWSIFWIVATGGLILLIGGLVIIAIKMWQWLEVTDKLKMVFVHLFSAFKAFGEWYIGFWVMAGESIWEYLDGPAHALGMFFNHLFKMFSMVGEKGPELFVPNQSGKIVPNKALNTSATQRLMDRALGGAQTGHLGKPVPVIITGGQIGSINVGKLAARATGLDKVKMAMNRL
jgi:hypothetical protein